MLVFSFVPVSISPMSCQPLKQARTEFLFLVPQLKIYMQFDTSDQNIILR
jgi:hypothetical protein